MVTAAKKEPRTPSGRLCKQLCDRITALMQEANLQALASGDMGSNDYTAACTAALEISLCRVIASHSLAAFSDQSLAASLLPGRLELATAMVGEQVRDSLKAFSEVCGVINHKVGEQLEP